MIDGILYTQLAPLFFQKDIIGTYYWYTVCSLEKSHTKAAWKMIFLWSREDGRPSNSSDIPPNMAGSIVKHMKSQCPMVRISLNSRQITMIPWDFSRRPMACSWGARWSQLYRWALVWAPLPQWKLWCWASCWAPHLGVWIHDPWRWENQLENPWKSWKSSGNTRKILEIHLQVYSRYTSNWQTARTEMLCALKSLFFFFPGILTWRESQDGPRCA